MNERITRRRIAWVLASLGAAPVWAQTKDGATIHFEVDYRTKPERIYHALLDTNDFRTFSGLPAEIDPRAGGSFKLFDGRIEGRNIELIANQRVVQAWRPASWAPGVYSIVRFELMARGDGTRIVFDHAGFPEDQKEHLTEGWKERYWEPLHKYLKA